MTGLSNHSSTGNTIHHISLRSIFLTLFHASPQIIFNGKGATQPPDLSSSEDQGMLGVLSLDNVIRDWRD